MRADEAARRARRPTGVTIKTNVSMKAARIRAYGGLDLIVYDEVPVPQPAADDMLIRVEAASVNPLDAKLVKGTVQDRFPITLPYILGTDARKLRQKALSN